MLHVSLSLSCLLSSGLILKEQIRSLVITHLGQSYEALPLFQQHTIQHWFRNLFCICVKTSVILKFTRHTEIIKSRYEQEPTKT